MPMLFTEFRCPKCDSTKFGGFPTRLCTGGLLQIDPKDRRVIPVSCGFSWEETEDWKYHRLVVTRTDPGDKCHEVASQAVLEMMAVPKELPEEPMGDTLEFAGRQGWDHYGT